MSNVVLQKIHAPRRPVKSNESLQQEFEYELEEGEIYDFRSLVKSPYPIPLPLSPGDTPPLPPSPTDTTTDEIITEAITELKKEIEDPPPEEITTRSFCGCSRRAHKESWIGYILNFL